MMSQEEAASLPSHDLTASSSISNPNSNSVKRKRSLPGTPDPDAEVISMSPKSLMATNRFLCEVCNKGFQRDQNLQLHRRGHNLPWKLKQRNIHEVVKKKVYVCPEKTCVHHHPSRALGDLTGIKKHFSRKHGEKKWKCQKCSKKYAVQSDWKAHSKVCGTREYRCDCGTLFSRKDSFLTHRAFCEALGERSGRIASVSGGVLSNFGNNILMNVQAPRIQQNLTGFSQEFGGPCSETSMANFADGDHGHKLMKLPLWLDHIQGNNNNIQNNSTSVFSSSSCTIPDIGLTSNTSQGQWVNCRYHEQESSFITSGPLSISAAMSQGVLKLEQEENKVDLSHSVTSFYPSYQNSSQGIFSNTNNVFGYLPSSNNNLSNTSSSNIVEIKKLFKQVNEDEKNFNDMVNNCQGSSSINVGEWKSQQPQLHNQLSLTRDFLGVGDDSLNRSFLHDHELGNFNPMMNMQESQFGEHYG